MTQQQLNASSPSPSPIRHRATRTTLSVPLDIGESITSVERRDGRIITTIVKVELDNAPGTPLSFSTSTTPVSYSAPAISPPSAPTVTVTPNPVDGYPSDNSSESDTESVVFVDGNQPPVPDPTRTGLPGRAVVPLPTELRRPANDGPTTKYYVVFAGVRVGIWSGNWDQVISPFVKGVRNSRNRGFESWDSALWHYAAAYQGVYPFQEGVYKQTGGWRPHIEGTTSVENPNASSYTWGTGPKIGLVDVAGL